MRGERRWDLVSSKSYPFIWSGQWEPSQVRLISKLWTAVLHRTRQKLKGRGCKSQTFKSQAFKSQTFRSQTFKSQTFKSLWVACLWQNLDQTFPWKLPMVLNPLQLTFNSWFVALSHLSLRWFFSTMIFLNDDFWRPWNDSWLVPFQRNRKTKSALGSTQIQLHHTKSD